METVILDDNKKSGSGTVILDENNKPGSGTVIIDTPVAPSSATVPVNNSGSNSTPRINGLPLAEGVEVLGYTIKTQMATNSAEADLFVAEKEKQSFAFKYYRNSHKPKLEVVEKIKNLQNPHIVKLFEYGFYNDRFFEIYEYAKAGNVNARKKDGSFKYLPLKEDEVFALCKDIVEAFNEFHQAGIIHRDIKPENFLLRSTDPLEIIIGDFGISSVMEEGEELHKTKTQSHTAGYVPREFLTADYKGIGTGIDYYSLGITLWEFATGGSPFINKFTGQPRDERLIMRDTREGRIADDLLTREPILSPRLQKLIRGLLVTDYTKRWGYSEVIRFLKGEEIEVAENEIRKIKVSILGQTYENEVKIASVLWNKKNEVTYQVFAKVADAFINFFSDDDEFIKKIQAIKDDITDPTDLQIPLLKFVYLINPEMSFDLSDDYTISSKEDVIDILENAPEVLINTLKHQNTLSFIFVSLILGENLSEKIKTMIKIESERNKKYYNMADHLFDLKLISKARLIIKKEIMNDALNPFTAEAYRLVTLREINDLGNLNEELKEQILEDVRENNYEGDIIPWLELQTGKRIEDFEAAAREENWDVFYTMLCESVNKEV